MNLLSKKKWIAIICVVLMAAICFVALPFINRSSKAAATTTIVRARRDIAKGSIIAKADIETAVVGSANLPAGTITDEDDVLGKYATVEITKGDFIFPAKLSGYIMEKKDSYTTLEDGTVAVTVTAPSVTGMLGNKIQKGDIVSYIGKDGNAPFELQYVKVDYIQNPDGIYLEEVSGKQDITSSMLTFIISKEQADFLSAMENNGKTGHLELICRGDAGRAERLLSMQSDMLEKRSEFREKMLDDMVDAIFDTYDPETMSFYEWYSAVVALYDLSEDGLIDYTKLESEEKTTAITGNTQSFADWYATGESRDMHLTYETTVEHSEKYQLAKQMCENYYDFMGNNFEEFRNKVRSQLGEVYPGAYWDGFIDWDEWQTEWEDKWYKQQLANVFLSLYDAKNWDDKETFDDWFKTDVFPVLKASETTDCKEVVVDKTVDDALKANFTAFKGKTPATMMKDERREDLRGALESYLLDKVFAKATYETKLVWTEASENEVDSTETADTEEAA